MFKTGILALAVLAASLGAAAAQHEHKSAAACASGELSCARTASAAFAADGTLWVVWEAGQKIRLASSSDLGGTFSGAVTIFESNATPLDSGPDARPKIALGSDATIHIAFATRDEKFNGLVQLSHSADGGKTFSKPAPVTNASPSQRFETMALTSSGRLAVAWIDKRNAAAAKKAGQRYSGAALALAVGEPGSTGIGPTRIVRDQTCECCRIAMAETKAGELAVVFRNIFEGGARDHAILDCREDGTAGELHRVSDDNWQTDACPHHGPSLAIGPDGARHVVWYTAGKNRKGVFYAASKDNGTSFSAPLALGASGKQISRPYVAATAKSIHLAWKEFDGERTAIRSMTSRDGGSTWTPAATIAETAGDSDHPLLVTHQDRAYLSWLAAQEGYRLLPLDGTP